MSKSYGEQFDEALKCETKEQAGAWLLAEIVRYGREFGTKPDEAERVIKVNLGYMAGYCDNSIAEKIYNLFGAAHPIFGRKEPTPEEALRVGMKLAEGATQ